jgi:hypothetical protein
VKIDNQGKLVFPKVSKPGLYRISVGPFTYIGKATNSLKVRWDGYRHYKPNFVGQSTNARISNMLITEAGKGQVNWITDQDGPFYINGHRVDFNDSFAIAAFESLAIFIEKPNLNL